MKAEEIRRIQGILSALSENRTQLEQLRALSAVPRIRPDTAQQLAKRMQPLETKRAERGGQLETLIKGATREDIMRPCFLRASGGGRQRTQRIKVPLAFMLISCDEPGLLLSVITRLSKDDYLQVYLWNSVAPHVSLVDLTVSHHYWGCLQAMLERGLDPHTLMRMGGPLVGLARGEVVDNTILSYMLQEFPDITADEKTSFLQLFDVLLTKGGPDNVFETNKSSLGRLISLLQLITESNYELYKSVFTRLIQAGAKLWYDSQHYQSVLSEVGAVCLRCKGEANYLVVERFVCQVVIPGLPVDFVQSCCPIEKGILAFFERCQMDKIATALQAKITGQAPSDDAVSTTDLLWRRIYALWVGYQRLYMLQQSATHSEEIRKQRSDLTALIANTDPLACIDKDPKLQGQMILAALLNLLVAPVEEMPKEYIYEALLDIYQQLLQRIDASKFTEQRSAFLPLLIQLPVEYLDATLAKVPTFLSHDSNTTCLFEAWSKGCFGVAKLMLAQYANFISQETNEQQLADLFTCALNSQIERKAKAIYLLVQCRLQKINMGTLLAMPAKYDGAPDDMSVFVFMCQTLSSDIITSCVSDVSIHRIDKAMRRAIDDKKPDLVKVLLGHPGIELSNAQEWFEFANQPSKNNLTICGVLRGCIASKTPPAPATSTAEPVCVAKSPEPCHGGFWHATHNGLTPEEAKHPQGNSAEATSSPTPLPDVEVPPTWFGGRIILNAEGLAGVEQGTNERIRHYLYCPSEMDTSIRADRLRFATATGGPGIRQLEGTWPNAKIMVGAATWSIPLAYELKNNGHPGRWFMVAQPADNDPSQILFFCITYRDALHTNGTARSLRQHLEQHTFEFACLKDDSANKYTP